MSVSDKILELRTHREAIRQAINDKGVELAQGSPMSEYAGAINEISGGEVNGLVQELVLKNGVVSLEHVGGSTLTLPQEPHVIPNGFLSKNKTITTLVNTEYVTEIGRDAFWDSNISGDLSFPRLTALVGYSNSSGEFFYNTRIASIDLPLLEILPYRTFYECGYLKLINIPNVKTIHYSAFAYVKICEAIILGENIPIIERGTSFQAFLNVANSPNCKFQVPPHMVAAYKADTFWSQYADRIIPYP